MAIPSKGIGWGTESNLLWQIAKQIQYLTKVAGSLRSSIISQTITCGVTDKAPSEDAVCQALALKQDILGKISLSDPDLAFFSDLETARKYVKLFTDADPTQEAYDANTSTYTFTVPPDTSFNFNNTDNFCIHPIMNFQDPDGLVVNFGNDCFLYNSTNNIFGDVTAGDGFLLISTGNNIMGDVTAGDSFLKGATGNNIMNTINVVSGAFGGASPTIKNSVYKIQSCGNEFASTYQGRMDVGLWGNRADQDLPTDIFTTSFLTWIRTPYSNQFINGGTPDLDVSQALSNLQNGNIFSTVIYE